MDIHLPSTSSRDDEIGNNLMETSDDSFDEPIENVQFQNCSRKKQRLDYCNNINEFVELESAFRGNLKTFYLKNNNPDIKDICLMLTQNLGKIKVVVENILRIYNCLKFNILIESTYVKPVTDSVQAAAFKTSNTCVFASSNINILLHQMFEKICKEESDYQSKGSGWTLFSVDGILLRFSRYRPLGGSSFIPLPKSIALKNAVINPNNEYDNCCFKWAILARYVNSHKRNIVDHNYFKLNDKFKFDSLSFPTPLNEIKIFEKNNPSVSVNVFGYNHKNEVFPLRLCNREKENHFDLLLMSSSNGNNHYCYINSLSRLVSSQLNQHKEANVFCKRCLAHFSHSNRDEKLEYHKLDCKKNKPVKVVMPFNEVKCSPEILKFKNFHFQYRVPIVAYCDFECILKKVDERVSELTVINENHVPMSFCVYLVVDSSNLPHDIVSKLPSEPYLFRGENVTEKFMDYMISLANLIGDLIDVYVPMLPLSSDEEERLKSIKNCQSCDTEFTLFEPSVRDHCHLTGRFRALLCNDCNLKRQNQKYLPVLIHGGSNYDNHFIVRQLGCDEERIDVIPNTCEKYISFSKSTSSGIKLRFLDSYRFLGASLSVLAKNLPLNQFNQTKLYFSDDELPLVTRKGVFPYEYVDSWEKLNVSSLPNKESFYNTMMEEHISDDDYNHAKNVWDTFNCQTLGQYSDLYLRTDVLLLSDVFESFRNLCLNNYNLDPAHYLSIPSLTFDAMLKYTKVELELLDDYDKYLFIEKGIRGGITSCVKRYAKANNVSLGSEYDNNKNTSHLVYIDANNLYGLAMSKQMPSDSFEWLTEKELLDFDVLTISDDNPEGYILECDLDYPTYLHDQHNDFPFLPENKCPPISKQTKLLTTLENKSRYTCHYIILKQAMQHGLVLQKVHRALKFNQSPWLKPYIDFNTQKRKEAQNNFEKDFYKLLNNAMFGKSIENVRKRRNLELVSSEKRLNRLVCKPNFVNRIIYSSNLSAVECAKETVLFNKPIYIGFTVLELSKYHMYNFHYDIMKPYYESKNKKINVLYIDTDSFFYEIFTNDVYSDFISPDLKMYFDMSDYPVDHKCYDVVNKKKLGCFKDECCGVSIKEFIGLRPKLYTYKTVNDDYLQKHCKMELKKAKGITKPVIRHHIAFKDYKKCLLQNIKLRRNVRLFRSKKHIVQTVTNSKIALSASDDKRNICIDGISTLAYGHYLM